MSKLKSQMKLIFLNINYLNTISKIDSKVLARITKTLQGITFQKSIHECNHKTR